MNQVIIAYGVQAHGEIRLSPELAEYKLMAPEGILCWPGGTGQAMAEWQRRRCITPRFMDWPQRPTEASAG